MSRFRKIPEEIEAFQWSGDLADLPLYVRAMSVRDPETGQLKIATLEGVMRADLGDWIIKGGVGEIFPCKPVIFAMTYEEIPNVS